MEQREKIKSRRLGTQRLLGGHVMRSEEGTKRKISLEVRREGTLRPPTFRDLEKKEEPAAETVRGLMIM